MADYFVHVATHLALAACALVIGCVIGGLAGYGAYRNPARAGGILGVVASLRVVPSVALLVVFIPWLGIGFVPALIALTVLAAAPVALAVDHGLRSVSPVVLECARALGMDETRLRRRVVWPLAVPVIAGGVRTAAVEVVASATLAAFVGAGGLGEYIVEGLSDGNPRTLAEGGITVAVLAWAVEFLCTQAAGVLSRRYAA